jgi:membrane-associated phospholipid phosphatase
VSKNPNNIDSIHQKTACAILLLSFMIQSMVSIGQNKTFDAYSYKPDKGYFKSYWTVTKKIPTGPARWRTGEWLAFSGIVVGGIVVYAFDDEIRQWIQRNPNDVADNLSKYAFEPWGSGFYPVILLGGFYVYGLAAKKQLPRQVALAGVQAFLMTAITTQVIKHLTGRHRPNQDDPPDPYLWEGPFKSWEYDAFPSGHTSTAFALATIIASVYRDHIWVALVSYAFATGTAWSRIYDNKHWPTDVLFGAALGFAIGKTVYHVMQGNTKLTLGISQRGDLALVYRF